MAWCWTRTWWCWACVSRFWRSRDRNTRASTLSTTSSRNERWHASTKRSTKARRVHKRCKSRDNSVRSRNSSSCACNWWALGWFPCRTTLLSWINTKRNWRRRSQRSQRDIHCTRRWCMRFPTPRARWSGILSTWWMIGWFWGVWSCWICWFSCCPSGWGWSTERWGTERSRDTRRRKSHCSCQSICCRTSINSIWTTSSSSPTTWPSSVRTISTPCLGSPACCFLNKRSPPTRTWPATSWSCSSTSCTRLRREWCTKSSRTTKWHTRTWQTDWSDSTATSQ